MLLGQANKVHREKGKQHVIKFTNKHVIIKCEGWATQEEGWTNTITHTCEKNPNTKTFFGKEEDGKKGFVCAHCGPKACFHGTISHAMPIRYMSGSR